jgi:hypothetical protein
MSSIGKCRMTQIKPEGGEDAGVPRERGAAVQHQPDGAVLARLRV